MLPNMRWGLFLQQHQFHQENAKSSVDLSNKIIVEHLTTWIHQKLKAPISSVLIFDILPTNSKLFPSEDESFDSSAFLCHLAICPTAQPSPTSPITLLASKNHQWLRILSGGSPTSWSSNSNDIRIHFFVVRHLPNSQVIT